MIKTINNRYFFSALSSFCSILILLSGCTTTDTHSFISIVPEEVVKKIRHVLIVPAAFEPQIKYHPSSAKGRDVGIAKGMADGSVNTVKDSAVEAFFALTNNDPMGILLYPLFITGAFVVGGTVGGIKGALEAVPEEKSKQIEETVNNALEKLDVQGTIAEHVQIAGNNLTGYKYTILKGIGPRSQEETPYYQNLNLEDNDIILEVRVISLGFKGGKGSNPNISAYMKVNARIINVADGEEIYSNIWSHVSKEHLLFVWVKNNAELLYGEFDKCYQGLAEDIIERTFLFYETHINSK